MVAGLTAQFLADLFDHSVAGDDRTERLDLFDV
jgi:hypothetical protein